MTATVLGLDIGGSKTHGLLDSPGGMCEALAGSANIASVGAGEAGRQLDAVLDMLAARDLTARDVAAVCAGAAGVDTPDGVARLRDLLAQRLPAAAIRVVHDSELILAAAGLDAGIAVIAGTGSVAWGRRDDGTTARAGGWGYLLGDEGSGYWVAREAVRHALGGVDHCKPNRIGAAVGRRLRPAAPGPTARPLLRPARPPLLGRACARRVRTRGTGDEHAQRIVAAAADALADLARSVAQRLDWAGPVVLAGGLAVHQPLAAGGGRGPARRRSDSTTCGCSTWTLCAGPSQLAHQLTH